MNVLNDIKNMLGNQYSFKRYLNEQETITRLNSTANEHVDIVISSLTAGCMRIDAVIYNLAIGGEQKTGYDIFVKDTPDSVEWICYDNLNEPVAIEETEMEQKMFEILDQVVENNGLSYTECCFDSIEGKSVSLKKSENIEQKMNF